MKHSFLCLFLQVCRSDCEDLHFQSASEPSLKTSFCTKLCECGFFLFFLFACRTVVYVLRVCVTEPRFCLSIAFLGLCVEICAETHPLCVSVRKDFLFLFFSPTPSWAEQHLHSCLSESTTHSFSLIIPCSGSKTFQNFFFFFCPVFVFSCCGVFSFFAAGSAAGALQKIPTTSCKQQAVRMTSSCHKVFYVSLRSHSFHSSLHCCKSTQCHV